MARFVLKYKMKQGDKEVWTTIGHGTPIKKNKWFSVAIKLYGVPTDPEWDGSFILSENTPRKKKDE